MCGNVKWGSKSSKSWGLILARFEIKPVYLSTQGDFHRGQA